MSDEQHFDILIVGAGLAGIGTACRLQQDVPGMSLALLERRAVMGGTWDLFRYPGVRSDTDMYSYGYRFRPWQSPTLLANGETLRNYIADAAREHGIVDKIHFGMKVIAADWSSTQQRWRLDVLHEPSGQSRRFTCKFLIACTGYYDHDAGYLPTFPGQDLFRGQRIHPQHWPPTLDLAGKNVVVIGSGATAMTIVPAVAPVAAHVTMLQRSPTYVVSLSSIDGLSKFLERLLPKSAVYRFAKKRFIWLQRGFYLACRRWPGPMRRLLLSQVRKHLGDDTGMPHFTPTYQPWDQRICVVPDADLFEAIRSGKASVVTDRIASFTADGIQLESGTKLEADIIVTATGLVLQTLGGMALRLDGEPCAVNQRVTYKGVMLEGVPNFALTFGGGNAPWTLRVELAAHYIARLLKHMADKGHAVAVPRDAGASASDESILALLQSGYVERGSGALPRQGHAYPWRVTHHLGQDATMLLKTPIEDRWLAFAAPITRQAHASNAQS